MPSVRRPSSSRSPRPVKAVRRTAAPSPAPASGGLAAGLTTRAAILGLVVCALVVSAALPLREYLGQRGQIEAARAKQVAAKARVAELEAELRQLRDPAYTKALARTRLHFVLPGETAYVVLAPTPQPLPPGATAISAVTATGPEAPWYAQVWSSVQTADRPSLPTKQAP